MRPFTLEVFVPSGDPDGVLVASMNNWLGKATIFPRGLIGEVKGRKEFQQPGVYILIGGGKIYIGEGDPVGPRLESHVRQKEFWKKAIFFNSEAGRLNKAHVQHLESRLVQLAKESGRAALENGNMPIAPALSESEYAFAENFLNDILLILPLLGFHQFDLSEEEDVIAQEDDQSDMADTSEGKKAALYSSLPKGMQFKMDYKNLDSTLEIVDGGVMVKKGSQVMVEGRMQTRSWDDTATNTKKYRTEVIADRVQFGTNSGGAKPAGNYNQSTSPSVNKEESQELDTIEYPEEQINAEDIPF